VKNYFTDYCPSASAAILFSTNTTVDTASAICNQAGVVGSGMLTFPWGMMAWRLYLAIPF
jgi:hypothetical protein